MQSILNTEKGTCFLCGRSCPTERHHIFNGYNRKKSEKYGLVVDLCHWCHNEPPQGVHYNAMTDLQLKQIGEAYALKHYGWDIDDFIKIFGKNYL